MKNLTQNFKNVIFLIKPYWKYGKLYIVVSLLIACVVMPISTIATVLYTQTIIDAVGAGASFSEIIIIIFQFVAILIGAFIVQSFFNIYGEPIMTKIHLKINKEVYDKALKTDYKYFDDPEFYNNYTWAINEFVSRSEESKNLLVNIFQSISVITSMLAVILAIGPWIVVITLAMLVLTTTFEIKRNKLYIKRQEKIMPLDRKLGYAQRIFYLRDYAADLRSTNIKNFIMNIYESSGESKFSIIKSFCNSFIIWLSAQNFLAIFYNAAIMAYISYSVIVSGSIVGVGKFAGLIAANNQLYVSLSGIFGLFSQINNLSLYAKKIQPFFEADSPIEMDNGTENKKIPEGSLEICFKNVNFSYTSSNFFLKDINFKIAPGERIAIVGENGVGKTTMLKLLLRLYDVDEGEILINGESIKDYDVKLLRSKIGVAFQNPNMYAISLADNLRVYENADNKKLDEIVEKINIAEILEKSNTNAISEVTREFSDDGIMLSGGEAQKIALGRILMKDFGLLVLDEPSSSLDPIAEYELIKLIYDRSKSVTSIIIAHRLSVVRDADRIYVMDGGEIIESGNHEELIGMRGKYYEMFTKQSENYIK